jgi:hypothetical protein
MRSILIDPWTQTVTEFEYSGDWQQISRVIGCAHDIFTVLTLDSTNGMFLDDGPLEFGREKRWWFKGYGAPLHGRAMVLGTNSEGESVDTCLGVGELLAMCDFNDEPSKDFAAEWNGAGAF